MEKYNEVNRKHHSDVYENKKVGVSKPNIFKKSIHLPPRPDDSRNRNPFVPKSKHIPTFNKKRTYFGGEAKHNFKHYSEPYGLKHNTNILVNAVSVEHKVTEQNLEQFHNFNGNILNVHPTLCNLTCAVPEISPFNRVLNFQSGRQNELPFSKSAKHKQRPVFSELRMPNIKNSSDAFANCKYPSSSSCNIRNDSSKDNSWNAGPADSYFPVPPNDTISEGITHEDFNLKCGFKYCNTSKDCKGIADLPIFVHSNFSKQSWEVKYCLDNKVRVGNKPRKWNSKNWNKVSMIPNRMSVNARAFEKVDKMLFPALPSNSHSQIKLSSSHTSNSVPPSEHSSPNDSDIESVHSFPGGNSNYTSSTFITSVTATIPQASYADVIRMSSATVHNTSDTEVGKMSDENLSTKIASSLSDRYTCDEGSQSANSEWIVSRLSKLNQNSQGIGNASLAQSNQVEQDSVAPRPIIVSLEKPSFYNSSLPGNKSILSISPQNLIVCDQQKLTGNSCGLNKVLPEKVPLLSETMQTICVSDVNEKGFNDYSINSNSICSSPSSLNSLSDAFKQAGSSVYNIAYSKSKNPPVIIMNSSDPSNMPEISFGIDPDEMIKLCSDAPGNFSGNDSPSSVQDVLEYCAVEENTQSVPDQDLENAQVQPEASHCNCLGQSTDAVEQFIEIKGKKIYWASPSIHGHCNFEQMAEYFAKVWKELEEGSKECCEKNTSVQ